MSDPEAQELLNVLVDMLTQNPGKHGSWVADAVTVALLLPAIRDHPEHLRQLPMHDAIQDVLLQPLLLVYESSVDLQRRKEIIRDGIRKLGYELSFDTALGKFCW